MKRPREQDSGEGEKGGRPMKIAHVVLPDPDADDEYQLPPGTQPNIRGDAWRLEQSQSSYNPVPKATHPAASLTAVPPSDEEYFPETSDPFLSSSTPLRTDSDESTAKFTSDDGQDNPSSSDAHNPSNDEQAAWAPLPTPATTGDARDRVGEDEQSEYDNDNDDEDDEEDGRDGQEDDDEDEGEDEE